MLRLDKSALTGCLLREKYILHMQAKQGKGMFLSIKVPQSVYSVAPMSKQWIPSSAQLSYALTFL